MTAHHDTHRLDSNCNQTGMGLREMFLNYGQFYVIIDLHTLYMGVSKNRGTPKSSILIGVSIINHPFWGYPYFWKPPCRK